ncbi:MarR family winged helix-turn-helix transcriptional regulator [Lacrimispora sp. 210928-DFI.3.58]|uniref:MarR family winged helix-turn-helix transcriptional regulator n=1 Tax=Lacrimispora sp. 210928-DFI.3.58 TaxID=2883214 RepID=UPI001D08EAA4|nr:MarR family winged helix-turn-helix transcriptional regulator [Lacrimispora sp. 210928-DFI.3.58]MCB7320433.1 MarR family winged helix-turn-helix transcriptional regulator [Lacrimispora sp. 210928-DFI.3.58]
MDPKNIGLEIRTLSNLIHRKINQMVSEEEDNLTAHQNWVLHYLYTHQDSDVMQRDIEAQFSIRRSTASHMLQLMEQNGYIKRLSVPEDARMKRLVITEKGLEARARMRERLDRFERLLQAGLSEEELSLFSQIIERLKQNIQ